MSTQPQAPELATVPQFTVGDRLWKAREMTGKDQTTFAAELGISRGSVSNYERSATAPKPIVLREWSRLTGVPLEWLAFGEVPGPTGPGEPAEVPDGDTSPGDREAAIERLAAKKSRHAGNVDTHRYAA